MNFGKTIYEKFKDPNCPNQDIVLKMEKLSDRYTTQKFFRFKKFEEETLWTLYALQEGVSSVASSEYIKRGNGSIRFIESFFNIKGPMADDKLSQMTILSGNTKIVFDGKYQIVSKNIDGESYQYMTFNKTGNIEDKPDENYVTFVDNYFPGTMIIAKILFNQDDTIE